MKRLSGRNVLIDRLDGSRPTSTTLGAFLDSGGEGALFDDGQRADYVVKIFHRPELAADPATVKHRADLLAGKEPKVRAMLPSAPTRQVEQNPHTREEIIQIAWPQELVLSTSGAFMGFTMRRLDMVKTTELTAWNNERSRNNNQLAQDDATRLYLLANLAAVVAYVNQAGHAVVDLKGQNVRAYRSGGHICLLDCDGFTVRSKGRTYPADLVTEDYRAPEHQGSSFDPHKLDETQDRFALAVLIFEFLSGINAHPSSGTAPPSIPKDIPDRIARKHFYIDPASHIQPHQNSQIAFLRDDTQEMFRRAFLAAPDDRTTSLEWREHLRKLIDAAEGRVAAFKIEHCPRHPHQLDYGKGCPRCQGGKTGPGPRPTVQITQPSHFVQPPLVTSSTPGRVPSPAPRQSIRTTTVALAAQVFSLWRRVIAFARRHPRTTFGLAVVPAIAYALFSDSDVSNTAPGPRVELPPLSGNVPGQEPKPIVELPPSRELPPGPRPSPPQEQPESTFSDLPHNVIPPRVPALAMVEIPMGTPWQEVGHRSEEEPQLEIRIGRSFWASKYEVSFDDWDLCAADGGCNGYRPKDEGWGRGLQPVIHVSWSDANAYAAWLSARTGENYRLPTEAEWEYLARAGTATPYSTGTTITMRQANFDGVDPAVPGTLGYFKQRTTPIGSYPANDFSLHDLHGNVAEWVMDCATSDLSGAQAEGAHNDGGNCQRHVVRGGAWASTALLIRSGYRSFSDTDTRNNVIGFRLVRD